MLPPNCGGIVFQVTTSQLDEFQRSQYERFVNIQPLLTNHQINSVVLSHNCLAEKGLVEVKINHTTKKKAYIYLYSLMFLIRMKMTTKITSLKYVNS